MADEYIRRNDFIQYLEKCKKGAAVTNLVWAAIMAIERDVRDMPAADVVEVVRCRDCKYGDYDSKPDGAMVCLRTKDGFWRKETDFCSYVERMRQAKRGKTQRKYREILALYRHCVEAGMDVRLERLHDGWAVRFPNGGDFAQHAGTYGTNDGFVEPAIGCEADYSPVSLREAEKLICENRKRLMTPNCEEEQ